MNERIGKLAVKAGAHWDHGDWNMPSAVYFSERELEKFAELIVKECAVIVGSMEEPHQDIAKLIKQHFGVEE
jgi:hypothetical protein